LAAFKGGALNLSPLKLQLTTDGNSVSLVEWGASFQGGVGTAHSRPTISRPSALGTTIVRTDSVPVDGAGTSRGYVISQFDTQPTLPAAGTMLYAVQSAITYRWQAPVKEGLIAYAGDGLLLYALAGANGSWDGEMIWEEL
jgi:hypothetical protein